MKLSAMESELELDPKAQNPSIQSFTSWSSSFLFLWNAWFVAVALFLCNVSFLPHCSRQKFFGFKVALDDEGTAEGWLFWDDGQSIGE